MSLRQRAAITGVGELPTRRTSPGETTLSMIAQAARLALLDAQLRPADIDGLLVGPHVGETPQHVPAAVSEYLGLQPSYANVVDLGGASGPGMVWRAAAAIMAGMCTTVLCVLGNSRDPAAVPRSPNRNPIREFDVPYGASGANPAYAMIAQKHMAEFGTTEEQLALIPVAQRANAQLNPDAVFYGSELTVEDVLAAPYVVEPFHLPEIVMPCAGGAAVIVTSLDRALDAPHRPALIQGAGEKVTHRALSGAPSLTTSPLGPAMASAYAMAGVDVHDVDMFSLYDCYSIMVAITLEDAGLVPKGEVGPWLADQDFSHRGNLPMNTHGGQLACGQADLAGGMSQVVEAARQVRGSAGARQVPQARTALATGNGATMSEAVALILGAES